MASQINLFDSSEPLRITKTIRLIELFAGYGSQALALKYLGIPFEHWGICEIDKFAVQAYNALHDTEYIPSDITKLTAADLRIEERDKYEYIMTYSFPCTDLSLAGKCAGMEEGSGTRSALLWEVRRLLEECGENLPQILLMENVPQVIDGAGNFAKWLAFLYSLGYESRYAIMDAGDYGIPQSRRRCFCISWLAKNARFAFPSPFSLGLQYEDIIEQNAPDDYFFSQKQIDKYLQSVNVERERESNRDKIRKRARLIQSLEDLQERFTHMKQDGDARQPSKGCSGSQVLPWNTTARGLARALKASQYKCGVANLLRADGYAISGVAKWK